MKIQESVTRATQNFTACAKPSSADCRSTLHSKSAVSEISCGCLYKVERFFIDLIAYIIQGFKCLCSCEKDPTEDFIIERNEKPEPPVYESGQEASDYSKRFNRLPTETQKKFIKEILHSSANDSYSTLWRISNELESKGAAVRPLHPLRFLEAILDDKDSLSNFKEIVKQKAYGVWTRFAGDLASNFKTVDQTTTFKAEVRFFTNKYSLEFDEIINLIKKNKIEEFLNILSIK